MCWEVADVCHWRFTGVSSVNGPADLFSQFCHWNLCQVSHQLSFFQYRHLSDVLGFVTALSQRML